jgi:hypothetical protein
MDKKFNVLELSIMKTLYRHSKQFDYPNLTRSHFRAEMKSSNTKATKPLRPGAGRH